VYLRPATTDAPLLRFSASDSSPIAGKYCSNHVFHYRVLSDARACRRWKLTQSENSNLRLHYYFLLQRQKICKFLEQHYMHYYKFWRSGIWGISVNLTTEWMTGVWFPQRQRIFSPASVSRPDLRPTHRPVQRVFGVLYPGVKRGRGVTLTTDPSSTEVNIISRSYTPSVPKRLHGVAGQLYFFGFFGRSVVLNTSITKYFNTQILQDSF
jgi:hypothetical protein